MGLARQLDDDPETPWNRLENYFPGANYCDWLAISAYGPLTPRATGTHSETIVVAADLVSDGLYSWNPEYGRIVDRYTPTIRRHLPQFDDGDLRLLRGLHVELREKETVNIGLLFDLFT